MFRRIESDPRSAGATLVAWTVLALTAMPVVAQSKFPGVGRPATPAEVKAWDIDVRSDFVGLPKGAGTVAKGQIVWDAKCASCHGTFGESNEVFPPIVGGTTANDIKTGRAAALTNPSEQRTTLMKLSSIATLWDYINRAMPWTAPKTLTVEEVYAVTAYILNLGEIVPADFTLSDQNMVAVQERLPNRRGMTREHGLWDIKGKPDVQNTACMRDCPVEAQVRSTLPDHARNVHGNLMAQHRIVGPARGVDTTKPPPAAPIASAQSEQVRLAALATLAGSPSAGRIDGLALAKQHACVACHAMEQRTVGPSVMDIAGKYQGRDNADALLIKKVKEGGAGVWGDVPMPAQSHVSDADIKHLVQWMLAGSRRAEWPR